MEDVINELTHSVLQDSKLRAIDKSKPQPRLPDYAKIMP